MRKLKTRQDWTVDIFDNVDIFDAVNLFAINPVTPNHETGIEENIDERVQKRVRENHNIKSNDSKGIF